MLKNATPSTNLCNRPAREVFFVRPRIRELAQPSPSTARRMGHRRATAGPPPGIAIDIENVAARNLLVVAVFASEEYGYHATLPHP